MNLNKARQRLNNARSNYETIKLWVADANRNPDALPIPRGTLLNLCKSAKAELREAAIQARIAVWVSRARRSSILSRQAW